MSSRTADQQRDYYWANRERILLKNRETYLRTRAQRAASQKAYVQRHPDRIAARRTRRRGARLQGDLTAAQWIEILDWFDRRCAYCGSQERVGLDHFIPISKGGPHIAANVIPACLTCNSSKSNKLFEDWLKLPGCPAVLWL